MLIEYYVVTSALIFLFLFSIWSVQGWVNKIIKTILCVVMIVGSYLTLKQFGF